MILGTLARLLVSQTGCHVHENSNHLSVEHATLTHLRTCLVLETPKDERSKCLHVFESSNANISTGYVDSSVSGAGRLHLALTVVKTPSHPVL